MHAVDFSHWIVHAERNQGLMARIALNALGLAKEFPVDVSELRMLSADSRAAVNAFLDWVTVNRDYRFGEAGLLRLEPLAIRAMG
jgi:hypothetical protein